MSRRDLRRHSKGDMIRVLRHATLKQTAAESVAKGLAARGRKRDAVAALVGSIFGAAAAAWALL